MSCGASRQHIRYHWAREIGRYCAVPGDEVECAADVIHVERMSLQLFILQYNMREHYSHQTTHARA